MLVSDNFTQGSSGTKSGICNHLELIRKIVQYIPGSVLFVRFLTRTPKWIDQEKKEEES